MSPPKDSEDASPAPTTPQRPAAKDGMPATPGNRRASAAAKLNTTPKSAPAAAVPGAQRKKPEPTLLSDFLLGRQSPARVAAQNRTMTQQRRKTIGIDAAGVREELRQEMRAAAVRKLQQPGGVRDRVKAWQKGSVEAMKAQGGGIPDAESVATVPTDFGEHIAENEVTEKDRMRIKLRHKPKARKPSKAEVHQEDNDKRKAEETDPKVEADTAPPDTADDSQPAITPKKRIISDAHWMKQRGKSKSPPRGTPTKAKQKETGSPSPIPKDFLQRTAQNPSVQNKIKDWAQRVEVPESPKLVKKYQHAKTGATVTVEEDESSIAGSGKPSSAASGSTKTMDDGIRVRPMKPSRPEAKEDDGIRIKPMRRKEPPDDGIRIRPGPPDSSRDDSTTRTRSSRPTSRDQSTKADSSRREPSPSDVIEVIEEDESVLTTPSKKPSARHVAQRRRSKRNGSPKSAVTQTQITEATDTTSPAASPQDSESDEESGSQEGSIVPPTVLGNKSLKEIPFGYSAFSELELPLKGQARSIPKRPKPKRASSSGFTVPNVLKKVVSGAKDIIHDKVDPPKPVTNQPRSIESWLNTTVDPFVEDRPKKETVEKEWAKDNRRRSAPDAQAPANPAPSQTTTASASTAEGHADQENAVPKQEEPKEAATPKAKTPVDTAGLKRSRATRSGSSPMRPGVRRPFREVLKEAFRGESAGHRMPAMVYPTCNRDALSELTASEDMDSELSDVQHTPGANRRSPSPDPTSTISSSFVSSQDSSVDSISTATPPVRRRPPPTRGNRELSTIASEVDSSILSDTISSLTETTQTQSTAYTKESEVSRRTSGKSSLKRRLTKHSDLVSVLSLPDDGKLVPPGRSKSIKSSRSLHRKLSKLGKGGVGVVLKDFANDEEFYQRELKTLVDGVIPVLLTQVVHRNSRSTATLFAEDTPANLSKAVVNMGVDLEKLRSFHKRVPLHDIHHLFAWLEGVASIYDHYLDVWRLGFQDLVINLAPAAEKMDDDDSLINAMPRNEEGDIIGENGERVDVAYLLKKPLVRVKWMTKFLKAATPIVSSDIGQDVLLTFEKLHDKARKRHREETARVMDEDASNTDTTRARDLRSLAVLDRVQIDHTRQVAAKDSFSLDLCHSSGQRLSCQVELIHRDKPDDDTDPGDILIRDITNSRAWLLFAPISINSISARRGEGNSLVVMVRGTYHGQDWYELLNLEGDSNDQIEDWLEILGRYPLPPRGHTGAGMAQMEAPSSPKRLDMEIPVGERNLRKTSLADLDMNKIDQLSQTHQRKSSLPSTPTTPPNRSWEDEPSPDRTPTQTSYKSQGRRPSSPAAVGDDAQIQANSSEKLSKPSPKTAYRDDGAPPPPAHRSLGPKLSPPVELAQPARIKRRTSSPLKHEYHPSDLSSGEEQTSSASEQSDSETESESSSDELDENDVPDTLPGYSIKDDQPERPFHTESVLSESSITPSNSASQVGRTKVPETPDSPFQKFLAEVSYWSNKKGQWKPVGAGQVSIAVQAGGMEVHRLNAGPSDARAAPLPSSSASEAQPETDAGVVVPLVALGLTPVVMIRQSNAIDLEVRTKALPHSLFADKIDSATYRFRTTSPVEARALYQAVHEARLNNAKYIALAEEARFRSFGENNQGEGDPDGDSSSRRRYHSWFGRKNSYRASTRAPSQSQGSGSSISASGFLRRLAGGNTSFDIEQSTVDRQSRPGTAAGGRPGSASLYTSSASSSGAGASTPPRSISASVSSNSRSRFEAGFAKQFNMDQPLRVRLHSNDSGSTRWHDKGDCILQITRPPPGVRQELPVYHGLEKRIIVTHCSKKEDDHPLILLDAVLGSGCFGMLGSKGIICSIWEQLRDEEGKVGYAPKAGRLSGRINKWCFQCGSADMARHILGLLASEVPQVILN